MKKVPLLAKPWTVVTCKIGHPVYLTSRSVYAGNVMNYSNFIAIGDQSTDIWTCCQCKESIFESHHLKYDVVGWSFYVNGKLKDIEP